MGGMWFMCGMWRETGVRMRLEIGSLPDEIPKNVIFQLV